METKHHISLASSDLSVLWTTYLNDTMAICGLKYFLHHVEDTEIKAILEYALHLSERHVQTIAGLLTEEQLPVPQGFSDSDVNVTAPRLFSDTLMLFYIINMAKFGINGHGLSFSYADRRDVADFFAECLASATELHQRAQALAQHKGLHVRAPYIVSAEGVSFVHDRSFIGGWFTEKRPLLALEIAHLVFNIKRNAIGKALVIGFSQVAKEKRVREHFERGRDIARKHMEVFGELLDEEFLPAPTIWDAEVSASRTPPFSDKLMMFHISVLSASQIGQYGVCMSSSPRRDIGLTYGRLMAELGKYAEESARIMIDNGWMEEPPRTVDRGALVEV